MLCFFGDNVAYGNHLRVLRQKPLQQVGASSAYSDEAETRLLGRSKWSIDHGASRRWTNRIRNRGLIEFQRGSGHGAKLQKLPPARGISHWFVLSNTQEDLAPVHPVKEQPVDQQNGSAQHQGLEARTKNEERRVPQVGEEITVKKIFP